MKLYKQRFGKSLMKKEVANRVETRDCLIWEVNKVERWCGVIVPGADIYHITKAYFPSGWFEIPQWLKPGNAARITHTSGTRGRLEIVSQGVLCTTPVLSPPTPPPEVETDSIISGLVLIPIPIGNWMRVAVTPGYVRFNNVVYTKPDIPMGEGTYYMMGMGGYMGDGAGTFGTIAYVSPNIPAPGTGTFRYDLFEIGADLVIDRVQGNQATSDPVMPSLSADHLKIGHVLLYGGMTRIVGADINATWTDHRYARIVMMIADDDLAWTELSTTVTLKVKDNYDQDVTDPTLLYRLEFVSGNGIISYGSYQSTTYLEVYSSSSSCVFTYTRNQQDPGDISPVLMGSIAQSALYPKYGTIILRDINGDVMQ